MTTSPPRRREIARRPLLEMAQEHQCSAREPDAPDLHRASVECTAVRNAPGFGKREGRGGEGHHGFPTHTR